MMALSFCPTKGENPAFFLSRNALLLHVGKSYCPYTEKLPQVVSSPILNPIFYAFWNGGKDSGGRIPRPPGNSALAGMDTAFAELIILASAVLTQEERPF